MSTVRRVLALVLTLLTASVLVLVSTPAYAIPVDTGDSPTGLTQSQTRSLHQPQVRVRQQAHMQQLTRADAARVASAARSRQAPAQPPPVVSAQRSTATQHDHGSDGTGLTILALTALTGLAIGIAGTTVVRKVHPAGRSVAV